jgi:hypothetical protein
MTTLKPPILAAISGAIGAYLAAEEAAGAAVALPPVLAAAAAGPPLNLWGLAGRQQAMQLRLMMQRRSLK